jgi:ABC-type transport system involved in multi-copper enzyme maturation permease subunit
MGNRKVGFGAVFTAEGAKLLSQKWLRNFLVAIALLGVGFSAIILLTIELTQGTPLAELAVWDIFTASMLGIDAVAIMVISLSAIIVGSEFTSGSIESSLINVPSRLRLMLGKITSIGTLGLVIGIIMALIIFGMVQLIMLANGLPLIAISQDGILQALLICMLIPPFYGIAAAIIAFYFNNSAGGIVGGIVLLGISGILGVFSDTAFDSILPFFPQSAIHSLAGFYTNDAPGYSTPVVSVLVLAVWIIVLPIISYARFQKRDI